MANIKNQDTNQEDLTHKHPKTNTTHSIERDQPHHIHKISKSRKSKTTQINKVKPHHSTTTLDKSTTDTYPPP